ncbi:MAG: hypothetical protein NTV51_11660 [Verrucomicrobia bacterium]|nr:hypothetical protein [Verrucomicrobiota bacterium]
MSRLGKIARLPRPVRDTLNVRLQEGEPGPELLAWLNAEPAVQAVLAAHFGGQAINAQNLSDWRRGGHAVWCQQQQIFELAERLHEEQPELAALLGEEKLAGSLTQAAELALLRELRATWGMAEGPERLKAVLAVLRASDRLQRAQRDASRAQREERKAQIEQERAQREELRAQREEQEEREELDEPPEREERPEVRPARPAARREAAREVPAVPPLASQPARCSPPPAGSEPAGTDDAQIDKVWAAALKLAKGAPSKPLATGGWIGPKFPVLQAA